MRADEPAYPCNTGMVTRHEDGSVTYLSTGLTVREAFVMAAMQGLCANPGGPFQRNEISGWSLANCSLADLARTATDTADATLAQLEKCDEAG